jgi:hypothetical protein
MTVKSSFAATAAVCVAMALAPIAAHAACAKTTAGSKWHLHALESDGAVIRCFATFTANGQFTAPCKIFESGMGAQISQNVSGTINVSAACDVTGSVSIPGPDPDVTIRYGHINGNVGSGTATQGTNANLRVLLFSLVKQ